LERGAQFSVGTDACGLLPPAQVVREMKVMTAPGMKNRQILLAATVKARIIGVE
jgi:imidazolonepropionase-like amidohydrolase